LEEQIVLPPVVLGVLAAVRAVQELVAETLRVIRQQFLAPPFKETMVDLTRLLLILVQVVVVAHQQLGQMGQQQTAVMVAQELHILAQHPLAAVEEE
jgi:predicted ABC-type sugar transport system permease subunit